MRGSLSRKSTICATFSWMMAFSLLVRSHATAASHDLDLVVDELGLGMEAQLIHDLLQQPADVLGVVAHRGHAERDGLPHVLIVHFGDRDVEAPAQAVLDAAHHMALFLQGM